MRGEDTMTVNYTSQYNNMRIVIIIIIPSVEHKHIKRRVMTHVLQYPSHSDAYNMVN